MIWNLGAFGTIRQVSGEVKPFLQRLDFLRGGGAYDAAHLAPKLLENARLTYGMIATSSGARAVGFGSLILLVASAALLPRGADGGGGRAPPLSPPCTARASSASTRSTSGISRRGTSTPP